MAGAHQHAPGGFHPHLPGFGHRFLGKAIGATMWFFIFYRIRKDGGHLIPIGHNETYHVRVKDSPSK